MVGSAADIDHIFATEFLNIGAAPGPFESWLLLRGLRTLAVRLRQHQQNTAEVVNFLADHPQVEAVYYPFHYSHPQYELAQQQMRGGPAYYAYPQNP